MAPSRFYVTPCVTVTVGRSMDIIFIRELRAETLVGIYAWERQVRQTIEIDLEIALPSSRACETDNVEDTIDYSRVVRRVHEELERHQFKLLEALAEHLARCIREEFKAPWVRVSVAKLRMMHGVKQLGVVIERGQRPG